MVDSTDRREPAVRVIDCVLSLNRNYDRFVVPRLNAFEKKHPGVRSVRELRHEIRKHPTPAEFVRRTLNYDHAERAKTLSAVVDWLSRVAGHHAAAEQVKNLQIWAQNAKSSDYKELRIRGFGLAGFQYLRMLFGANTTKPDCHIFDFVKKYVGGRISPERALGLLEQAAVAAGVNLRDADAYIWEKSVTNLSALRHLSSGEHREGACGASGCSAYGSFPAFSVRTRLILKPRSGSGSSQTLDFAPSARPRYATSASASEARFSKNEGLAAATPRIKPGNRGRIGSAPSSPGRNPQA
jgi:hypothetical protein